MLFAEKKENETKDRERIFKYRKKFCYVSYLVEGKNIRKEHTRYGPPCTHFLFFFVSRLFLAEEKCLNFFWKEELSEYVRG